MDDCSNILYDDTEAQSEMGQSDSKGAKKKSGIKASKGVATSFGFRRRPASSSRADDNLRRHPLDSNGNGGSTEELYTGADVLSGRSTPLARPRKESAGVPLRTNRFGFRQPTSSKTAKVSDVNVTAEQAFSVNTKDFKQCTYNNNAIDKTSTNGEATAPFIPTQMSATSATTVVGAGGVPKTVTKQTVILTYQPQQIYSQPAYPSHRSVGNNVVGRQIDNHTNPRSSSASRAQCDPARPGGKYTLQCNQLPRPQYPAVRMLDTKSAKQVANNSRKISGSSDGSREGSATDSGVSVGGECGGGESAQESPRAQRRRPRNLEMVMKGSHSFHLRELNVTDLDIMDDAVITEVAVIPLPKLPSTFDYEEEPKADPAYTVPPALTINRPASAMVVEPDHSPMSTLERYRTRTRERPNRIQSMDWRDEEKFVLDRAQPEKFDKQNSFIKSNGCGLESPATVNSSKESSPSCKSDPATETWNNDAAGEAMATRSQDDVSLAYSTSSVEEERSKKESGTAAPDMPQKTIVITDNPAVPHPLLMKSMTASQHDALRSIMINSMSSSNYSGISVSTTTSSEANNITMTADESNFDMAALEASTHSLIDDETSPADSLISSTSNSDSNNDLVNLEREVGSLSSSAYQTANTKTKSSNLRVDEDAVDGEVEAQKEPEKAGSKDISPQSPGTPTNASGSLSLSDGRDYFDDEIADQPGLLLRKNNDDSPSTRATVTESEGHKQLRKSRERISSSPLSQRNRKVAGSRGGAERTPSLDTLSSLASDDMMMDVDLGLSVTSLHSVDDYIERLDSSFRSGLNSLNEQQLRQELSSSKMCAVKQWNQLLQQNNALDRQLAAAAAQPGRVATSCTSLSDIQASLPVRTARLLQRSRAHTPSSDGGGGGGGAAAASASEGGAAPAPPPATATLLQDVVDIKTLLLQLKRVLHEPGEEHHTKSSETLDPLLMPCADSPARGNGRRLPTHATDTVGPEHTAELRRQILYLQSQVEERDRLVRVLQQQMSKLADAPASQAHAAITEDTCNVATQTDRLRPPVATNLSNTENSGLVSWNEQNGRKLPTYSEAQIKTKRAVANGTLTAKCQCGRRLNGLANGLEPEAYDRRSESLQLKTNSRVGSRYLQAVAAKDPDKPQKRDLSVNERLLRKNALYASRSIENFNNQNLSAINNKRRESNGLEAHMKHHTSYSDLYHSTVKINGTSPAHNGQSTDTDYSSDGGYKSLPSSINCSASPRKVSGIPRRSIERRLFSSKPTVKASAI